MFRLFLALRYLLTRPINLLGMLGITLSVWALIVVVSLFSGFLEVIEEHVQEASADISVTGLPPWSDWRKLSTAIRDDPNVHDAAPRFVHFGLVNAPDELPPIPAVAGRFSLHGGDQPFQMVYGVDPAAETAVSGFGDWIRSPDIPAELRVRDASDPFATTGKETAVLVGLDRLQREGLRRGDLVNLTTGRPSTSGREQVFVQCSLSLRIAGAFKSRHGGFDDNILFLDREQLREELAPDRDELIHEIAVKVIDDTQLEATRTRLESAVGRALHRGDGRLHGHVQTWQERNQLYLGSIEHQRALLKIVLVVILVVAAFLMLATLSMMVTEKVSDIGILTAMGATPIGVTRLFLLCGLVITIIGVTAGSVVGITTAVYLEQIRQAVLWAFDVDLFPLDVYNLDRVPCSIDLIWILEVAGLALATGFLASALPAWRAARHDPLVSLRGH